MGIKRWKTIGTDRVNWRKISSAVEAVIFSPDDGGVKTSWKSAGGRDAGKAIGCAGVQMLVKKAIGIGETVGVKLSLCIGIALFLFLRFQNLFLGEIRPTHESDT
ncbi:hypothetical protein TNCV_3808231 [Trichonephila clavipes]|nr:hypothetical protein TNCV_3808231 [Trichonephila clavipes]